MAVDRKLSTEADVVDAFLRSCLDGDPDVVADWVGRHPEHADALREAASTLTLARPSGAYVEPGEELRAERRASALARAQVLLARRQPAVTFRELLAGAGLSLPELAERIDIDREPVAEVESGHVTLPVGRRFVAALAAALGRTVGVIEAAIRDAHDHPRLGYAASDGPPKVGRITWQELIEDSDMTPEQKRHWLADD